MAFPILATAMEALAAGFGVAAALVIIGTLLSRWYRLRQEFVIMKLALEKGAVNFPPPQPQWLISFRQGCLIATLGAGLILVGGVGVWLAAGVANPGDGSHHSSTLSTPERFAPPSAPARDDGPRPPPPRDPAMVAWEQSREQTIACMSMIGGGIILLMLGLVRIAFVPFERKYAS